MILWYNDTPIFVSVRVAFMFNEKLSERKAGCEQDIVDLLQQLGANPPILLFIIKQELRARRGNIYIEGFGVVRE